ncbi:putative nuclease YhcG [Porphyromonas levii]|uniref:PDDEXK nuclease domain-containing protein n=1 Tax=Porphyromonas levii TaxID=28114 RepID=UPI001BA9153C|nr:PDDEXK nuclease domain-containing protein [Porphyromonas levii]MBR8785652.1 putative nuclease YhcG [Porphyromonas levii]
MSFANIENTEDLYHKVARLIEESRAHIVASINLAEVYTKFRIGQYIVEEEQRGETRAQYGKQVLLSLAAKLTEKFGNGWSYSNLRQMRQFFVVYSNLTTTGCHIDDFTPKFTLSWSHYLLLMRVENPDARKFNEIESSQQQWSKRQLSRQIGSSLYERLALSRDKEGVMRLAQKGQVVEKPFDIIKDPITLEFLGLKPDTLYSESKFENAIIGRMQQFLLELGKGFLFEARQKRFTFEERHFYVDLVFYNRLLQCYVLIDLKTGNLSHQDLGQMQMYVNYYDRYVRQDFENPTIGILLCENKSDALVELTLPQNANIYASVYQLYLPDKALPQSKVKEWISEFRNNAE